MSLYGGLRRSLTRTIYLRRYGAKWAGVLADNAAWPMPAASVDGSGALVVEGMSPVKDPGGATAVVLRRLREMRQFCLRGGSFEVKGAEIYMSVSGIQAIAYNEADLGIFFEIFNERTYDYDNGGPCYILDIGANIGLASLFFAASFDADVRAFELVPSTAEIARRNVALNPKLAQRIAVEAYGLSDQDGEFDLPVAAALRSSNSMVGLIEGDGSTERVQVKDAAKVFEETLPEVKGRRFVVKLDAEGAEYEIVARLASQDLLRHIDLLFLEWHERPGHGPDELRRALQEAGFHWFERYHPEAPVGYITAYRS